ncbi:aquaporin [Promicromonospora sp. MEB111]|uniref:MIP/aquaporin family protein n=1 Tax=unclassified Promicromonospora TaxID=2647929 RepID=UPI00254CB86B|nr:aquaporin [Promicromonospora sp. MEB111]
MSQDLAATSGVTEVEERSPSLLSRLLAETFGTFLLTLVIVGVLVYSPLNTVGGLGVALGGGFAYIAGAAAVGRVSGAHFNPAISLGAWLSGRISLGNMFSYWGAQLVGAILAAAVLFATVPQPLLALLGKENTSDTFDSAVNGFSQHSPLYLQTQGQAQFDWLPALLVEVIISAILVGVYLGVHDRRSKIGYAPVAVGSAIAALTLVSWFVTNTGMNPARSTAAALFANNWGGDGSGRQLWLFWLAPLVGAALAALFYRAFASVEPEGLELDEEEDDEDEDDETAEPVTAQSAPAAEASEETPETPEKTAEGETESEKKADDKA